MANDLVSVVVVTRNRKNDLRKCIDSLKKSAKCSIELIIVDNGSEVPVLKWLRRSSNLKILRSEKNLGAAAGRNFGLKESKGEYILFVDDDAYVDKNLIAQLLNVLKNKRNVGIVHPKIYDSTRKNVLQGLGCDINLLTGRVSAKGIREKDKGQYDVVQEIQTVGCIWLVKKKVFEKIGNYDEEYFIPYEDTDFSIRAKKAGYKILFVPTAKAWHRGAKDTFINPIIDYLGIRSEDRAFRISRNKIIFMRKNAPFVNFLLFIFVITPIYLVIHSLIILTTARFDILREYWQGFLSGLWYIVKYNNPLSSFYKNIDNQLLPLKQKLMIWTDPICLVVNKSARTFLDVGSGLGVPMELLKKKVKVRYAVGVDLFKPYIQITKSKKIHDKYVLTDARKMRFKKKSFDVVFASDAIEHMNKKDSWKVIEDMERFAKKQVIITTSLGYFYHPAVDNNQLQLHKSGYKPEEFIKRGYKTFKYGRKEILGTGGLVHTMKFDPLKKLLFITNFVFFPFYILFPDFGNYCFVAYKDIRKVGYNDSK